MRLLCKLFSISLISFSFFNAAQAQTIDRNSFRSIDSLARNVGPMRDSSLNAIVRVLTRNAPNEVSKVRAIYIWVAKNIAYDCAHRLHPERVNNTVSYAIKSRIATSEGFAGMVSDMCRMSYIRCETVRGLIKTETNQIGKIEPDEMAGAWNVVTIGTRQYVLDAGAGAGVCEGKDFYDDLTDAWFLTNRSLFSWSHFPNDKKMQLLETPVERSTFQNGPTVYYLPSILGARPLDGQHGMIKAKQNTAINLSYFFPASQPLYNTGVLVKGTLYDMPFQRNGDTVTVLITFPDAGKYPFFLTMNNGEGNKSGKPWFGFMAEVAEHKKH